MKSYNFLLTQTSDSCKILRTLREAPEEFSPVVFNDVKKQEMRQFKKGSHALQEY